MTRECNACKYYAPDYNKPRISRCQHPLHYLGRDTVMMATEGRLPNNACGVKGMLFEPAAVTSKLKVA